MKLEVCQLTRRQATEFEREGKVSECKHHGHVSLAVAHAWIRQQTHRWVRQGWSIVCDIMHWVVKNGGLQLVPGVDSGGTPGRHYPIGAHGAAGRMTKVAQNNLPQEQLDGKFIAKWTPA